MVRLPEFITTERLTLRRWRVDEAAVIGTAITSSINHLSPWMAWIASEPLDSASRVDLIQAWNEEWEAGGDVVLGVFRAGEVVGGTGLHRRRGPGILEVGYWVHAAHIGHGYATEIAKGLTTCAFELAEIESVEIHHDKANVRSRAVPEKLGFSFDGETEDEVLAPAESGIDCRWTMARSEWPTPAVSAD